MSEHIMEKLTIRPLNDVSEKLSKRANEHEVRSGTLSALTERCNRLEAENAKLRELCTDIWNDALHFEGFWDYVHDDGTIYREDELPHYQERMRECGIEVK